MLTRLLAARRATPARLRETVDAMPLHLRIAMLDGVRHDDIIVGAYTDSHAGVCPMLAAHRRGPRCSYPTFAPTWDAFAGAPRRGHRPADPARVDQLARMLRDSIETELRAPTDDPAPRPSPAHRAPEPAPQSWPTAPDAPAAPTPDVALAR